MKVLLGIFLAFALVLIALSVNNSSQLDKAIKTKATCLLSKEKIQLSRHWAYKCPDPKCASEKEGHVVVVEGQRYGKPVSGKVHIPTEGNGGIDAATLQLDQTAGGVK